MFADQSIVAERLLQSKLGCMLRRFNEDFHRVEIEVVGKKIYCILQLDGESKSQEFRVDF
jgi:hypothetical protein